MPERKSPIGCLLCLGLLAIGLCGGCSDDGVLADAALDATPDHGAGIDLSGTDLSGTDLSGTDLSGTDLSGADLSGADLSGTDLSGADLNSPDLGAGGDGGTQYCFFEESGLQIPVGQQKCPCPGCDEVVFCSLGSNNEPVIAMGECMAGMECQENIPGAADCYCNNAADGFCPADVPWGGDCPNDPDCV